MIRFKEVLEKFPSELRDAVIEFYDFLREEYIIKREEFEELKKIVGQLVISHEKLLERVEQLTIAQQKTEERVDKLGEAVEKLAEAQRETEEELKKLTITVKNMQKELGGISHSVGFDLENQAYKALPKILKERYGIEIKERLLRKFIEYPDGREEEINVYGKGKIDGREIFIIGESKTYLSKKDIERFKKRLERIKKVFTEEIFPIFVVHSASPKITKYAENSGFSVFFSYEF
ncbi:MAG TPA: chordopoxvirus fusion protein [bacterium]|nr:chordopoxvirus fusion protein [bacterium]